MNWAHVHLIINHFPVIGMPGALLVLGYGLARKSGEVKLLGLGLFVLIALITIPVFFTGGEAEKIVKDLPSVTEASIGTHAEMATLALALIELLGAAALGGLFLFRKTGVIPQWYIALVLIIALASAGIAGLTANLGGQIRHTEIREVRGTGSGVQGAGK